MTESKFGFVTELSLVNGEERWSVTLPHQCQLWDVAFLESREDALDLLDRFIAEADEARAKIAYGLPDGDRWHA